MNLRRSMPPLFALLSGWDEEGRRLQMTESFQLTIDSLLTYGPRHKHWAIAYSGGKDSSTLVTLIVYLIESGKVPRPETLTVLYADTRMELLPLWLSAKGILDDLAERGIETRTVTAPLEKRFLPYILGRGVPPPNNNTLRWCTRQIKIDPMAAELRRLFGQRGEKILMLTGVRQGESAIRDGRIAMSCGRNGGECGQGWYQETMPGALCDTLAPLLHWRVCHLRRQRGRGGQRPHGLRRLPPRYAGHCARRPDRAPELGLPRAAEEAPSALPRAPSARAPAPQAGRRAPQGRDAGPQSATHGSAHHRGQAVGAGGDPCCPGRGQQRGPGVGAALH
jgi:3'-phosphoadenosine 5'-phosphosulfate sulfotransferase (PAPS reductase)/FAD synthetase